MLAWYESHAAELLAGSARSGADPRRREVACSLGLQERMRGP